MQHAERRSSILSQIPNLSTHKQESLLSKYEIKSHMQLTSPSPHINRTRIDTTEGLFEYRVIDIGGAGTDKKHSEIQINQELEYFKQFKNNPFILNLKDHKKHEELSMIEMIFEATSTSLDQYKNNLIRKKQPISGEVVMGWAVEIFEGMGKLQTDKVMVTNWSPQNILLTSDHHLKMGFLTCANGIRGMRTMTFTHSPSIGALEGSLGESLGPSSSLIDPNLQIGELYLSPEYLKKIEGEATKMVNPIRADVYAIGMLLLDIICLFDEKSLTKLKAKRMYEHNDFMKIIDNLRLDKYETEMKDLLRHMLFESPQFRPNFHELVQKVSMEGGVQLDFLLTATEDEFESELDDLSRSGTNSRHKSTDTLDNLLKADIFQMDVAELFQRDGDLANVANTKHSDRSSHSHSHSQKYRDRGGALSQIPEREVEESPSVNQSFKGSTYQDKWGSNFKSRMEKVEAEHKKYEDNLESSFEANFQSDVFAPILKKMELKGFEVHEENIDSSEESKGMESRSKSPRHIDDSYDSLSEDDTDGIENIDKESERDETKSKSKSKGYNIGENNQRFSSHERGASKGKSSRGSSGVSEGRRSSHTQSDMEIGDPGEESATKLQTNEFLSEISASSPMRVTDPEGFRRSNDAISPILEKDDDTLAYTTSFDADPLRNSLSPKKVANKSENGNIQSENQPESENMQKNVDIRTTYESFGVRAPSKEYNTAAPVPTGKSPRFGGGIKGAPESTSSFDRDTNEDMEPNTYKEVEESSGGLDRAEGGSVELDMVDDGNAITGTNAMLLLGTQEKSVKGVKDIPRGIVFHVEPEKILVENKKYIYRKEPEVNNIMHKEIIVTTQQRPATDKRAINKASGRSPIELEKSAINTHPGLIQFFHQEPNKLLTQNESGNKQINKQPVKKELTKESVKKTVTKEPTKKQVTKEATKKQESKKPVKQEVRKEPAQKRINTIYGKSAVELGKTRINKEPGPIQFFHFEPGKILSENESENKQINKEPTKQQVAKEPVKKQVSKEPAKKPVTKEGMKKEITKEPEVRKEVKKEGSKKGINKVREEICYDESRTGEINKESGIIQYFHKEPEKIVIEERRDRVGESEDIVIMTIPKCESDEGEELSESMEEPIQRGISGSTVRYEGTVPTQKTPKPRKQEEEEIEEMEEIDEMEEVDDHIEEENLDIDNDDDDDDDEHSGVDNVADNDPNDELNDPEDPYNDPNSPSEDSIKQLQAELDLIPKQYTIKEASRKGRYGEESSGKASGESVSRKKQEKKPSVPKTKRENVKPASARVSQGERALKPGGKPISSSYGRADKPLKPQRPKKPPPSSNKNEDIEDVLIESPEEDIDIDADVDVDVDVVMDEDIDITPTKSRTRKERKLPVEKTTLTKEEHLNELMEQMNNIPLPLDHNYNYENDQDYYNVSVTLSEGVTADYPLDATKPPIPGKKGAKGGKRPQTALLAKKKKVGNVVSAKKTTIAKNNVNWQTNDVSAYLKHKSQVLKKVGIRKIDQKAPVIKNIRKVKKDRDKKEEDRGIFEEEGMAGGDEAMAPEISPETEAKEEGWTGIGLGTGKYLDPAEDIGRKPTPMPPHKPGSQPVLPKPRGTKKTTEKEAQREGGWGHQIGKGVELNEYALKRKEEEEKAKQAFNKILSGKKGGEKGKYEKLLIQNEDILVRERKFKSEKDAPKQEFKKAVGIKTVDPVGDQAKIHDEEHKKEIFGKFQRELKLLTNEKHQIIKVRKEYEEKHDEEEEKIKTLLSERPYIMSSEGFRQLKGFKGGGEETDESYLQYTAEKRNPLEHILNKLEQSGMGVKTLFDQLDDNGDQVLTIKEVNDGLAKNSYGLEEAEIQELMECLDKNSDRVLTYDEFSNALDPPLKVKKEFRALIGNINVDDPISLQEKILDLQYKNRYLGTELPALRLEHEKRKNKVDMTGKVDKIMELETKVNTKDLEGKERDKEFDDHVKETNKVVEYRKNCLEYENKQKELVAKYKELNDKTEEDLNEIEKESTGYIETGLKLKSQRNSLEDEITRLKYKLEHLEAINKKFAKEIELSLSGTNNKAEEFARNKRLRHLNWKEFADNPKVNSLVENASAITIQKIFKGHMRRKTFEVDKFSRRHSAKKIWSIYSKHNQEKRIKAIMIIQKYIRKWKERREISKRIQMKKGRMFERDQYDQMVAAISIQRIWRKRLEEAREHIVQVKEGEEIKTGGAKYQGRGTKTGFSTNVVFEEKPRMCKKCSNEIALLFCAQCEEELFCLKCFAKYHAKGYRRNHTSKKIKWSELESDQYSVISREEEDI